jgi:hypothetical protein
MPPKIKKFSENEKRLIYRYLVWCYKTTKEELDRTDRYFTQLKVDQFVLSQLKNNYKTSQADYKILVDDFEKYMAKKEENVLKQKFVDAKQQGLNPQYQYLQNRFLAIEKAIDRFLGKGSLKEITLAYEREMINRILQAREHS